MIRRTISYDKCRDKITIMNPYPYKVAFMKVCAQSDCEDLVILSMQIGGVPIISAPIRWKSFEIMATELLENVCLRSFQELEILLDRTAKVTIDALVEETIE